MHVGKSHCLVEWDDPGKPVGIVKMRNIICKEDEDPQNLKAGDSCSVCVRRGTKKIIRSATILGIGESLPAMVMCTIGVLQQLCTLTNKVVYM